MQLITDIIDGALGMAKLGYHVFPLLNNLKVGDNVRGTPLGWNHNKPENKLSIPSTTNLEEISNWAVKHSDLIGYGVNPRNRRAIILDVDVKDGKTGANSLRALISDFGLSLNTFCVKTKSGGLHLYYSYEGVPEGFYVKGLANGIEGYPFIDLRTDNTFVNGPTKDGEYKIVKDLPLADLPDTLITVLPIQPISKTEYRIVDESSDNDNPDEGDSTLRGIIPDVILEGERDNTLIRLIGSWARKHPMETTIALTEAALGRCKGPKLYIKDYISKIESTYEKKAFRPKTAKMLEWMENNLILIPERQSIYNLAELPHLSLILKTSAVDRYKNWIYYVETSAESKKKTKVYSFSSWMESPNRQTLKSFGYYPKKDRIVHCSIQGCDIANTYSPPFHGFKHNGENYSAYIDKFYEFCNMLFGQYAEWMIDWAAHQIQFPDQKLSLAPVMVSKVRGVGKNLFFDILKNLVGVWNTTDSDVNEAVDKHCEFALRHHLVLINEANIDSRDKKALNQRRDVLERVKTKITDNMQTVEPKYIGRFNVRTFVNYIVATNNLDAIPMEEQDRRFFVMEILAKKHHKSYYDMLWQLAKHDQDDVEFYHRAYSLREELLKRKITLVTVGDTAEFTAAKQEMIDANKSAEQLHLDDAIRNHASVFRGNIITKELFLWYIDNKMPRGNRLSHGAINDLFRMYFSPVRYNDDNNRSKQVIVDMPDRILDGIPTVQDPEKQGMFTVRSHGKYDKGDVEWLRAEYSKSLKATKIGYKEPAEDPVEAVIK